MIDEEGRKKHFFDKTFILDPRYKFELKIQRSFILNCLQLVIKLTFFLKKSVYSGTVDSSSLTVLVSSASTCSPITATQRCCSVNNCNTVAMCYVGIYYAQNLTSTFVKKVCSTSIDGGLGDANFCKVSPNIKRDSWKFVTIGKF